MKNNKLKIFNLQGQLYGSSLKCSAAYASLNSGHSTFREDCFVDTHLLHSFKINPQNVEWNYSILSYFINNFDKFIKDDNFPFIIGVTRKDYHTKFIFRSIAFPQAYYVIRIDSKISVQSNIDFGRLYFTNKKRNNNKFFRIIKTKFKRGE